MSSLNQEAVVADDLLLFGRWPSLCSPTDLIRSTAPQAEVLSARSWSKRRLDSVTGPWTVGAINGRIGHRPARHDFEMRTFKSRILEFPCG